MSTTRAPHSLRALQHCFARAITPRGTLPRDGRRAFAAARLVAAGPPLAPRARLGIYRFAYSARLREVMANDFPGVRRLVGEAAFDDLVTAYVAAHPSRHPNLSQLGRHFPAFLARRRGRRRRVAVVAVATFELALCRAFDAADASSLDAAALTALAGRAPEHVQLSLQPSVRLLAVPYDVGAWYETPPAGQRRPAPARRSVKLCVHRSGGRVRWLTLERGPFAVLAMLAAGASLAAALRRAPPGAPVAAWFRQWAAAGLFAAPVTA
jgi:hypothetical protein